MVKDFQDFPKRAAINGRNDFVPVSDMGANHILIKLSRVFRVFERPFLNWSILGFEVMEFFGLV